jgi:hypothetical protein
VITGANVLEMYIPQGGWIISGDDYSDIVWVDESIKITKAKFEAGFAEYETFKTASDTAKATQKAALLARLGITADEAALLLS